MFDPALASEPYCYLTTRGRVSGEPRTIEIWFALENGILYMLSGSGSRSNWVRNLKCEPGVSIRIAETTLEGRARLIEPGPEEALARRLLFEKYNGGYSSDLSDWRDRAMPVAVEFEEA